MKNIFLTVLLLSSLLLIGCNSTTNNNSIDTTVDEGNKEASIITNKVTSPIPPTKTLELTDKTYYYSPYITLGNITFFLDKENNNRLSTIENIESIDEIQQTDISDTFNYSAESLATINNIIYFSNTSDGNKLYSLDYQSNEIKKISDHYTSNLTASLNTIYYIDRTNNSKLHFYNIENSSFGVITNDSVGNFIINGDYILYQNLSDTASLYSIKLDGSDRLKLTDSSVNSFVIYKSEILYINSNDNNRLYKLNPITLKTTPLNLVYGQNLKIQDEKIFILDTSNNLSLITIDLEKNTSTESNLINDSINNYYPTSNGIFLEKSINVNKTYILKY